ncbi:MAG: DUF819 family protein [Firmicutes bacterium]|nr:DUF819 family protein [Bacillota bacterium]
MVIIIVQALAIFTVPILIIKYHNFIITKWLGSIGTAYLLGILVAVVFFLFDKLGSEITLNSDVGEIGSIVAISIAIPLLLFSANLKEARKLSKMVLKAFFALVISATVVSAIVFYTYGRLLSYGAELSGMAVGLYTGGTPNLNAIGSIFGLDATTIGVANLSDMIIGAVFYLFLLTVCKPLLSKFLNQSTQTEYIKDVSDMENIDDINVEKFKFTRKLLNRLLLSFGITALGAIFGIVLWVILGSVDGKMIDLLVPTIMITATVFGIIASFNKKIRETKDMNVLGQYFILVFSFGLASSLNFLRMQGIFGDILILFTAITLGVFVLHATLCKILEVDVDCMMVTLTAGVYGPAFVPAITKQIKNDSLTIPGLITGSIGYAIGTFLGAALGFIFLM